MHNGTIMNLFTLEGGISIIESFGISDFILVGFLGFLTFISILHLLDENTNIVFGIATFGIIIYFVTLYFYKINDGIYLAETIEKNDKVIGKGIEEKYNFDIVNEEYIKIIYKSLSWDTPTNLKFIYNKNKSNFLLKTYEDEYTKDIITVSLTGTVYWHKPTGQIIAKTKVYN